MDKLVLNHLAVQHLANRLFIFKFKGKFCNVVIGGQRWSCKALNEGKLSKNKQFYNVKVDSQSFKPFFVVFVVVAFCFFQFYEISLLSIGTS